MSGISGHKLAMVFVGVALLLLIGCTPGSSGSSSTSTGGQVASSTTGGSVNDPPPNSGGDPGDNPLAGDPGNDPVGDGASASVPEPATGLLFLCAAGSMALARLRARKRA